MSHPNMATVPRYSYNSRTKKTLSQESSKIWIGDISGLWLSRESPLQASDIV